MKSYLFVVLLTYVDSFLHFYDQPNFVALVNHCVYLRIFLSICATVTPPFNFNYIQQSSIMLWSKDNGKPYLFILRQGI